MLKIVNNNLNELEKYGFKYCTKDSEHNNNYWIWKIKNETSEGRYEVEENSEEMLFDFGCIGEGPTVENKWNEKKNELIKAGIIEEIEDES